MTSSIPTDIIHNLFTIPSCHHVMSAYQVFCEPFEHLVTLQFSYFRMHVNQPVLAWIPSHPQPVLSLRVCLCLCLLTLPLYFICAPSPDNSPGLQLDLKCPSLWPLGLLRIKQCQYCAQLQVSVQVVHLCVVVHPRNRSVGKEA